MLRAPVKSYFNRNVLAKCVAPLAPFPRIGENGEFEARNEHNSEPKTIAACRRKPKVLVFTSAYLLSKVLKTRGLSFNEIPTSDEFYTTLS